jgi:hypothetical protein
MQVAIAFPLALIIAVQAGGASAQTGAGSPFPCNDEHYVNSSGHWVHSPSCGSEPDRKEAICRDGSVSFSEHRSGMCSHHGGVEHWE